VFADEWLFAAESQVVAPARFESPYSLALMALVRADCRVALADGEPGSSFAGALPGARRLPVQPGPVRADCQIALAD
jgi:hypothetical protein